MRSYNADHRTPLAWRHRDMTLHFPHTRSSHSHHHHHHRPPSPSVTTSSSTDEREEVPMVRRPPGNRDRQRHGYHREGNSQFMASSLASAGDSYPTTGHFRRGGTLRSTRSVPALALATWDGEPCPVHGHGIPLYPGPPGSGTLRRHGSMFDMRSAYPPPHPAFLMNHMPHPPPPPMMDKKSFHGSLQMLAGGPPQFPSHFLPPMMRPRPFVIPAGAEPLPMRDPYKMRTPPPSGYAPSKTEDPYSVDQVCCKGHLIVLWIILAVVTIGVILGIVLGVTIA